MATMRTFGRTRGLRSAVSLEGVLPSFLVDGGITRAVFAFYLDTMLLPAPSSGQVLVLDT
ncbi:MAG TPA: hypothetical protein VF171_04495 [Trueperaceae bacterium]